MVELSRASLDPSLLFLAIMAFIVALLTLRAVPAPHRLTPRRTEEYIELAWAVGGTLLATTMLMGSLVQVGPVLLLFLAVAAIIAHHGQRLSMPGILWMATQASALIVSSLWGALFVLETPFPAWLQALTLTGIAAALPLAAAGLVASFAREAVLTHEVWRKPVAPSGRAPRAAQPKVSLHLACYAEPPHVVMQTMNRLAAQDYANFEVLVCDNNTADEALWKPLEAHSAELNRRLGREVFRFFHVAPLPGAKAGALNFCLDQMARDAEIVGVIDADYYSRGDFLSRLVPCFEDPKLGYVQTPHDYRDYAHSGFLNACYWEYMPTNKVDYAGVSEYGGAFTIGTMCLLRTEALRRAGGWAEWCLTEDSEVSVRLRAAGYTGLYFVETFGRGLIPETFDDYRKQRFRWTAGPVQQLRRHWRLFLPSPLAAPLPGWTKLLEVTRCAAPLTRVSALAGSVVGLAVIAAALLTGAMQPFDVPGIAWVMLVLGAATWWVRTIHRYRLSGCKRLADMLHGEIARASLSWVVLLAGIAGLSSRPLAWRRTPKFAVKVTRETPFSTTRQETALGAGALLIALSALLLRDHLGGEFAALSALGFALLALNFLCAPLMAALAIDHANRAARVVAGEPAGAIAQGA